MEEGITLVSFVSQTQPKITGEELLEPFLSKKLLALLLKLVALSKKSNKSLSSLVSPPFPFLPPHPSLQAAEQAKKSVCTIGVALSGCTLPGHPRDNSVSPNIYELG